MDAAEPPNGDSSQCRMPWIGSLLIVMSLVCPAFAAVAGQSIDLSGPWLMKDYTLGVGIKKQLQVPGRVPTDCISIQVPGTVRAALLAHSGPHIAITTFRFFPANRNPLS
jgi:hypothetical protein